MSTEVTAAEPILSHSSGLNSPMGNRMSLTELLGNGNAKGKLQRFSTSRRGPRRKGAVLPTVAHQKGRLVGKRGDYGIKSSNVPQKRREFVRDLYTTLIDQQWRFTMLLFVSTYLLSWTIYATIYYTTAYIHGDFDSWPSNSTFAPCIQNSQTFLGMILFSAETQGTIGYGYRYVTEECRVAIICAGLQTLSGVIMEAFLVAIVITKLARPQRRAQTIIFSNNAVISQRNGRLCFMFRIGDMRKTHLIDARVRLMLIKSCFTEERELLPFQQLAMAIGSETDSREQIFLAWPTIVCHWIDANSPLYGMSKAELYSGDFEIVAILEGTIESTGNMTQAKTSYKPEEILWGHRFEVLLTYQSSDGIFNVNYARFHNTYAVETPNCSAQHLAEQSEEFRSRAKTLPVYHKSSSL